ncbi:phosphatase PAP2 family protein [Miltoncostaea oceani]|uniref:phosphatase PAP2 family protein n=1 Tax=Miltoncostaea oceani TaxID=2843216 RepID=UPI001C3E4BFA|nr:phosphatase PAP2 family protein [Miltoncostaea oceani]
MPPAPSRRLLAARFAGLVAAASAGVAVLLLVAVRTATGQGWDDAGRADPGGTGSAADAATQRLLDTISVSSLALLGVAIMLVAVLRDRPWLAAGAGAVVAGANITTQVMKRAIDRPDLAVDGIGPGAGAFPSGHVTVASSLALALVLVAPPALRWPAALVGGAYAAGVGVAVLVLGWHRPSEVVGAYLVAVAWTALVAAVVVAARGPRELAASPGRRARAGAAAAVLLAVAFVVVAGVAAQRRLDVRSAAVDRTALTFASATCVAACAALIAVVTGMLQSLPAARTRRRRTR